MAGPGVRLPVGVPFAALALPTVRSIASPLLSNSPPVQLWFRGSSACSGSATLFRRNSITSCPAFPSIPFRGLFVQFPSCSSLRVCHGAGRQEDVSLLVKMSIIRRLMLPRAQRSRMYQAGILCHDPYRLPATPGPPAVSSNSKPSLCDPARIEPFAVLTRPVKRLRSASWLIRCQVEPVSSET